LATFGIPKVIKSDNGPPFNGAEFKDYAYLNGFKHRRITPLWPRANGTCERFMKNLGKVVRNSKVDGSSWECELLEFLRSYRASPHSSTGFSPNDLLFKTSSSTSRMPVSHSESDPSRVKLDKTNEKARIFDSKKKEKMKKYADTRLKTRESKIAVGDFVLIKQDKLAKSTTLFFDLVFKVVKLNGSQATVWRDDKKYVRNLSMLKKVNKEIGELQCPLGLKRSPQAQVSRVPISVNSTPDKFITTPLITSCSDIDETMSDTEHAVSISVEDTREVHSEEEESVKIKKSSRVRKPPIRYGEVVSRNKK
jgi:hypothetical protein